MTAVGIPTIMIRFGEEFTLGHNAESGNNNLGDTEVLTLDEPRVPPPAAPTESRRAEEPELVQETVPAGISRPQDAPKSDAGSAQTARSEKGKDPAEPAENDINDAAEDENEWMRYPLPPVLSSAPNDLPETVLEIVRTSVDNVAARVAEAEARRLEEEARQRALDEEAAAERERKEEKDKQKEIDYLPIIIPDPEEGKKLQEEDLARRRQAAWSDRTGFGTSRGINSIGSKERENKRHKYSVTRILGRFGVGDKGESNTTGAANNTRGTDGRGAESVATNALGDRDAILKQLGASVLKATGRKSGESSRAPSAKPPLDKSLPDGDPRFSQLRVAATLLHMHNEHPERRLSAVGSVRTRVKGKVKVIKERVVEGSVNEAQVESNNEAGDETVTHSSSGQAEAQSDGDSTEHEECISCFDGFLPETMVKAPCHSYCRDCFTRLIANALQNEQQWPPKCCLNEIPFQTIYACIETDLRNTFQVRAREWSTPIGERVYCHESSCSVWLSADHIDAARRVATCPRDHTTCTICRGAAHEGSDCPEDRDVNRTNELAEAEGWKRCARCQALVEHGEACQHMTCRCGYEFCYVCTRVWRTCECTMVQLMAVKNEAAERRREREEREAREETELQEALRQIENYELQEALEAIERSLERERKETLRRRRDIAHRLGEEERRRAEVVERFFSYREALASLNDHQREALDIDAREGRAALQRENAAELVRLNEAHESELAELRSRGDSRIEELERALATEFTERMAIEREAEEGYQARLTTYWSGMKNEEAEVDKAISAFRESMETRRNEWTKWRDEKVEGVRFVAGENLEVRTEELAVRRERKEKELRGKEQEETKKGRVGTAWFGAVVEEREALFRGREEREAENTLSFEAYDPVEVAIVREMLENGEEIEVLQGEDEESEENIDLPRQAPGSWPPAEAGPSRT